MSTPPNYARNESHSGPDRLSELPTYTPRRSPSANPSRRSLVGVDRIKEFEYDIKSRGKTMASLTVLAEASYSKHIPTFLQGSPVKGRVYLKTDKLDSVNTITVTIRGKIIPGADPNHHVTFLEVNQTLWVSGDGPPPRTIGARESSDPRPTAGAGSSSTSSSSGDRELPNGRFGGFTWDFALDIPREVATPCGRHKRIKTFSPPETFIERIARASVAYEVSVRFSRGKWQTDYRIPVAFGYIPMTRPPPFSTLRQLSYQENAPLLGPTVDTEGWHRVGTANVRGTLFNNRDVDVKCTLFLAKPLSYTRGSLIPLSLLLEGKDQHALDLLSASKVANIQLGRRIQYHYDSVNTVGAHHLRDSIDFFDRAVLWPSNEGTADPHNRLRYLNGELHIKPDAKPTSAVADFRIEYTVILLSFDASGFEPLDDRPILGQPVDIVSLYASGPRPRKYAPPGYDLVGPRTDFSLDPL